MKKLRIDKNSYSDSSKKSVGYEYLGEYYEDKKYRCKKCYKQDVFTSEEQKKTFEVKKAYMCQERFLCSLCYQEMSAIKKELIDIENNYLQSKDIVLANHELLKRWLYLLKEFPKYWQKENTAKIAFVKKVLNNA